MISARGKCISIYLGADWRLEEVKSKLKQARSSRAKVDAQAQAQETLLLLYIYNECSD